MKFSENISRVMIGWVEGWIGRSVGWFGKIMKKGRKKALYSTSTFTSFRREKYPFSLLFFLTRDLPLLDSILDKHDEERFAYASRDPFIDLRRSRVHGSRIIG